MKNMKRRYIIFYVVTLFLLAFLSYYIIIFCGVYIKSSTGWVFSAFNAILIGWFGFELLVPFSLGLFRVLAKKWPCLMYMFFYY